MNYREWFCCLALLCCNALALSGEQPLIYGWPGSRAEQKGLVYSDGAFRTTLDGISISFHPKGQSITQRLAWRNDERMPIVVTDSSTFQAKLLPDVPGHWRLDIQAKNNRPIRVAIGAPAKASVMHKRYRRLLIDNRWIVRSDPLPANVEVRKDKGGMSVAEMAFTGRTIIEINDLQFGKVPSLAYPTTRALVKIATPTREVVDAQTSALMMALENRPTTRATANDAYILVALARLGQLDLARQLVLRELERESDAPTETLWSVATIAELSHSPSLHARLWPVLDKNAKRVIGNSFCWTEFQRAALLQASAFADEVGQHRQADAWRKKVDQPGARLPKTVEESAYEAMLRGNCVPAGSLVKKVEQDGQMVAAKQEARQVAEALLVEVDHAKMCPN